MISALTPTLPRPRGASPDRLRVLLAADDEPQGDREAIRVGIVGSMIKLSEWTDDHAAVLWARPDGADLLRRAKAWIEEGR